MDCEDLRQVLALVADYGATLDEGRWEDHVGLYADDCKLHVFGKILEGKPRIDRFMRKAHRGKHINGVPRIEESEEKLTATSDFVFFLADGRLFSFGKYIDEFRRTSSGLRFQSRQIVVEHRQEA